MQGSTMHVEEWEEVVVSLVSQLQLCPPARPCHCRAVFSLLFSLAGLILHSVSESEHNASQFISGIIFCFPRSPLYGDNKLHGLWLTSAFQENCGLQGHILLSVMQKVCGLSQFCRITRGHSSSSTLRFSKAPRSSSSRLLEGLTVVTPLQCFTCL